MFEFMWDCMMITVQGALGTVYIIILGIALATCVYGLNYGRHVIMDWWTREGSDDTLS